MESKIAVGERIDFSDRLRSTLVAAGLSTRPAEFVRAFNLRADGSAVTSHAARKWLSGEAIPTQDKIVIIASWLGVHAAWLRFGDAENANTASILPEAILPTPFLVLVRDVMSLPAPAQEVVRDLVNSLLRVYESGHGDPATRLPEKQVHSVMPHRDSKK
jgi:transcriptional regulator with XRE-family HTH domain